MANDKCATLVPVKCSVCAEKFTNIQECLKHELLTHSLQKKSSPRNQVQKKLNAAAKFLNAEEKILERKSLKARLCNCQSGEEIPTIFELYCMKPDNLGLIFTRIQTCLEKALQSGGIVGIYPFGSIASGLALRDCDIDIYLDVSNMHISSTHTDCIRKYDDRTCHQKAYNLIDRLLHRSPHFTDVYAIRRARVPIIKCKHKETGFSIDINVSWPSSRANTQFIYDLGQSDQRIHEVMLFLKLWAKNVRIVGRDKMTSYCLITMVIFFLQQPRKLENQKTNTKYYRILKPIKELQENCQVHMVQGVNYAYNLSKEENKPTISTNVTTWDLIKEFFDFYHNFNFEEYIISPYFGKPIAKNSITLDLCEDYHKQLNTMKQYLQGEEAHKLQIDRCMCVQDAFCLNQNTSKNMTSLSKQYFLLCIQNGRKISENRNHLNIGQLYEELLFETINKNVIENLNTDMNVLKELPPIDINTTPIDINNQEKAAHTIYPSKADLRAISVQFPDKRTIEEIRYYWCQHYVDGISTLLTKLYLMDIQNEVPVPQKQLKKDTEEKEKELNKSWLISCTIDLWSNRCFQKQLPNNFITYQLEQTKRLHTLRRQNSNYSVTLNSILKLNILKNYKGIDIQLESTNGASVSTLNKKDPLRRFFNLFKNTLQSCTFKDMLNIDNIIDKNGNELSTNTVIMTVDADN